MQQVLAVNLQKHAFWNALATQYDKKEHSGGQRLATGHMWAPANLTAGGSRHSE